jgi:hypothetical protein
MELKEILDELVEYNPSLYAMTGPTELFNWRALFDFSSCAWEEFSEEFRLSIIKGLAEQESLFIALMTYKTMYMEMKRPDIVNAASLSLARIFENLFTPLYENLNGRPALLMEDSLVQESFS